MLVCRPLVVKSVFVRGMFWKGTINFLTFFTSCFQTAAWQVTIRDLSIYVFQCVCMCMLDILLTPQDPGKIPFS